MLILKYRLSFKIQESVIEFEVRVSRLEGAS
jgi:hypothetical protein